MTETNNNNNELAYPTISETERTMADVTFLTLLKDIQSCVMHCVYSNNYTLSSECHTGSDRSNNDGSPTIRRPRRVYCKVLFG